MAFTRAKISWNIKVKKIGYKLIINSGQDSGVNQDYPYENHEKYDYNKLLSSEFQHVNQNYKLIFQDSSNAPKEHGKDGIPDWWLNEDETELNSVKTEGYNYRRITLDSNLFLLFAIK